MERKRSCPYKGGGDQTHVSLCSRMCVCRLCCQNVMFVPFNKDN